MNKSSTRLRGEATSTLEKGFASVVTPFQEFIRDQKTASLLLLACTLLALVIANSPLAHQYESFIETRIGFVFGDSDLVMSLRHWVNDGLMALFFFILGLEIKRELLVGELRETARSVPVVAAAAGGSWCLPCCISPLTRAETRLRAGPSRWRPIPHSPSAYWPCSARACPPG
jgi:NhaA family Na+:H+ antiporter